MNFKGVVLIVVAVMLAGCSTAKPSPLPVAPGLEVSVIPATPAGGQNYRYCYGCVSGSFFTMVLLSQNPVAEADTTAVTNTFNTSIDFVPASSNFLPEITTSRTSITIPQTLTKE